MNLSFPVNSEVVLCDDLLGRREKMNQGTACPGSTGWGTEWGQQAVFILTTFGKLSGHIHQKHEL